MTNLTKPETKNMMNTRGCQPAIGRHPPNFSGHASIETPVLKAFFPTLFYSALNKSLMPPIEPSRLVAS